MGDPRWGIELHTILCGVEKALEPHKKGDITHRAYGKTPMSQFHIISAAVSGGGHTSKEIHSYSEMESVRK